MVPRFSVIGLARATSENTGTDKREMEARVRRNIGRNMEYVWKECRISSNYNL